MSGFSDKLEMGKDVLYKGERKTVKDWHFVSADGCHNSDLIVVRFTDGTISKNGFKHIEYVDKKKEYVTTAKELAYLAFIENLTHPNNEAPWSIYTKREKFENWWAQKVWNSEHKDCFEPKLNVYIDGKRYIQAE